MNKIVLNKYHQRHTDLAEITSWCRMNVGKGSQRFKTNTWMGTDDWYCYLDLPPYDPESEEEQPDVDEHNYDFVFVFRREEDSTLFAMKWA